jgi:hypothetical protein
VSCRTNACFRSPARLPPPRKPRLSLCLSGCPHYTLRHIFPDTDQNSARDGHEKAIFLSLSAPMLAFPYPLGVGPFSRSESVPGSERTKSHKARQITFGRGAGQEPGSSPRQRIRFSLKDQPIRRVEAAHQAERAAGPAARLLRGQDYLHLGPAGGGPDLAANS